ncbi:hypothetical protein NDU88_002868 [Pleurodeles waltl]|uniref:Uncharacterized protein n=1 Tax=Pleurodeles waltl TaxID=8319 RepID=A0AAV7VES5_PLEWA|nr:hypothetical protein NDU88_002868 [Pleurodeles waltl]
MLPGEALGGDREEGNVARRQLESWTGSRPTTENLPPLPQPIVTGSLRCLVVGRQASNQENHPSSEALQNSRALSPASELQMQTPTPSGIMIESAHGATMECILQEISAVGRRLEGMGQRHGFPDGRDEIYVFGHSGLSVTSTGARAAGLDCGDAYHLLRGQRSGTSIPSK